MIEARRRAYLEAMGIDVWVARASAADSPTANGLVQLGPGQGSSLLVCSEPADSAGRFAGDLARALGGDPVWAWPDREAAGDGLSLREAIDARLFTRVILLGADTARWLFAGEVPSVLGSAAVTATAGVAELCASGTAKRALWRDLRAGPCGDGGGGSA